MDCPKCGVHHRADASACRMCGHQFITAVSREFRGIRCPTCGADNPPGEKDCSVCRRPMRPKAAKKDVEDPDAWKRPQRTYADYPSSASRTARVGTGGVLIIMAGFFTIADIIMTLMITYDATQMADYRDLTRQYPYLEEAVGTMVACQALRLMFAVPALLGGMFAIQKKRWGLAMLGGVLGTLAVVSTLLGLVIPFWGLIAVLLFFGGIVGTVLVGVSRREFVI